MPDQNDAFPILDLPPLDATRRPFVVDHTRGLLRLEPFYHEMSTVRAHRNELGRWRSVSEMR
jgi:hypothetical protein